MTARLATAPYGIKEVSSFYHRYAFSGLSVGVIFQFIIIGLYFALRPVVSHNDYGPIGGRVIDIGRIDPVPFSGGGLNARVSVPVVHTPSSIGRPVPVPMIDIKDDAQVDNSPSFPGIVDGQEGGLGTILNEGEGKPNGDPNRTVDLTIPFSESMILPQVARNVTPDYPGDARRLGVEGMVVVKLLINTEGKPVKAEIASTQNEMLNDAAKKAALQWLFTPAIANGYLVSVWMNIPFRFRLNR